MEKSAIAVFGSREEIVDRWTDELKARLEMLNGNRQDLAEYLFPDDPTIIDNIMNGTKPVTTSILQRFSCALGLSPAQFLNWKGLSHEQEVYWTERMHEDKAFAAGGTGGPNAGAQPELTLKMYIVLSALEELDSESQS